MPKTCNGVEASAIEFLDIYDQETDTCEILGLASQSRFHLLDDKDAEKGLMVTYLGGAICEGSDTPSLNGLPRKVIYTLECGNEQDNNVILLKSLITGLVYIGWNWIDSRNYKMWVAFQNQNPSCLSMVLGK